GPLIKGAGGSSPSSRIGGTLSGGFRVADRAEVGLRFGSFWVTLEFSSAMGSLVLLVLVCATRRTRGRTALPSAGVSLAPGEALFREAVFFSVFIMPFRRRNGANLTGQAYVEAKPARNGKLAGTAPP